jgi:molybdopterin-guanine dinucleotide biosynthesis protein
VRIVVAGMGRKTGKTTLVEGLIAAAPERRWVAVKISHHAPANGAAYDIVEETDPEGHGDTRRYLRAGSARSYWVRGDLLAALPELKSLLAQAPDWIVESGQAARLLEHDLVLVAVDVSRTDRTKLRGLICGGELDPD